MSSSASRRSPARSRPEASSSTWTAPAAGVDRTRMEDRTDTRLGPARPARSARQARPTAGVDRPGIENLSDPRRDPAHRARSARQILLAGFGEPAQASLLESPVLVIGAGGPGAPVLSYLAALGVGTISVIDPDIV